MATKKTKTAGIGGGIATFLFMEKFPKQYWSSVGYSTVNDVLSDKMISHADKESFLEGVKRAISNWE